METKTRRKGNALELHEQNEREGQIEPKGGIKMACRSTVGIRLVDIVDVALEFLLVQSNV